MVGEKYYLIKKLTLVPEAFLVFFFLLLGSACEAARFDPFLVTLGGFSGTNDWTGARAREDRRARRFASSMMPNFFGLDL